MTADATRFDTLHAELRAELTELTTSDQWLRWLDGARRFHRYSPTNRLLLMLQGAEGHCASYRTWGRIPAVDGNPCQVRRGERGLTIFAPITVTRRDVDEATGEQTTVAAGVRGFRPVKVFHQGQLVAPPALAVPPRPALLTGPDRWQHVWAAIVVHLDAEGYTVALHTAAPFENWNGRTDFAAGHVEVMDHLEPPQRLKTLIHEWAHVALGHGDPQQAVTRELREIEAESVTYLVCSTIGLDSTAYSIPYLAHWSGGDGELAERTARHVLATTSTIVDALETRLGIDLTPDLQTSADGAVTPLPNSHTDTPADGAFTVTADADTLTDQAPATLRHVLGKLDPADRGHLLAAAVALDEPDAVALAVALCADAGLDSAATVATLGGLGAEPVTLRRAMKQCTVDDAGCRRPLFDNVDEAFHSGPMPAALAGLPDDQQHRLLGVDVDQLDAVRAALPELRDKLSRGEVVDVLRWLGVTQVDIDAAIADGVPERPHPVGRSPRRAAKPAVPSPHDTLELLRYRVAEHETLLRRVVDETRDPDRLAALASGLGMTYTETIATCAHIGLDADLTAQIAVTRRGGNVAVAVQDLAEGWTAPPPDGGWAAHLPATQPDSHHPPVQAPDHQAARAILAQWAHAATTPPPQTPSMP